MSSPPSWASASSTNRREPERLALIHFGVHEDVGVHLDRLESELDRWAGRVRDGMSQEDFVATGRADLGEHADVYDRVAPLWQSYLGMQRYWETRKT